jgi:hypothetical protein
MPLPRLVSAAVLALLARMAAAAPYEVALDASAHAPLAQDAARRTALVQEVTRRLGDAGPPGARVEITLGALERGAAPPGIGFEFGNPRPDLGRTGTVAQAALRCRIAGATVGTHETRLALPEPTALERLAGHTGAHEVAQYASAAADTCARALRVAGLRAPQADFRSAVVVVSPQRGPGARATHPDAPALPHASSTGAALRDAAPGDVIFEFGQRR